MARLRKQLDETNRRLMASTAEYQALQASTDGTVQGLQSQTARLETQLKAKSDDCDVKTKQLNEVTAAKAAADVTVGQLQARAASAAADAEALRRQLEEKTDVLTRLANEYRQYKEQSESSQVGTKRVRCF